MPTAIVSPTQNKIEKSLRIIAKCISYIFHPIFIPLFVTYYLLYIQPYFFLGLSNENKFGRIAMVGISITFFPALTVFLLWRLKFIQSIQLRTQKERIIPYVAANIFFFWAYYVSRNQIDNPVLFTQFLLGVFIASSAALVANSFTKISMHVIGVAGVVAFLIYEAVWSGMAMGLPISISIFICGIVCSARLLLKEHTPAEVVWGLVVGIFSQLAAAYICH